MKISYDIFLKIMSRVFYFDQENMPNLHTFDMVKNYGLVTGDIIAVAIDMDVDNYRKLHPLILNGEGVFKPIIDQNKISVTVYTIPVNVSKLFKRPLDFFRNIMMGEDNDVLFRTRIHENFVSNIELDYIVHKDLIESITLEEANELFTYTCNSYYRLLTAQNKYNVFDFTEYEF